jgi:hypothetical protein
MYKKYVEELNMIRRTGGLCYKIKTVQFFDKKVNHFDHL